MPHKIALNFEDGVTRFLDCLDGEKIADAAYRRGVNIPLDCREGACGACKSHLEAGRVRMEDYVEDALSAEEEAAGMILTCKSTPLSDCVVRILSASTACFSRPQEALPVRIAALRPVSDSGFVLSVEGESLAALDFLPGQYATLTVPGTAEQRAYSFSSLVDRAANRVEFLIRRVPGGLMSGYLAERARVGDALQLSGPKGGFYLRPVVRPLLFLAGGTGLAPFLAMLELLRGRGDTQPVHLILGVNREADLVAEARLQAFAAALPAFTYTTCLATPEAPHPRTGFVHAFITPEHLHGGDVDVYLCGPPPMVTAVERTLDGLGTRPAGLYYEKFLASH